MGHFGGMHFIWWVIGIIVFIWIFSKPIYKGYQKKQNPLDILKERLAKGEITKEEFDEAKKIVNSDN
jgi:putative membrane protein